VPAKAGPAKLERAARRGEGQCADKQADMQKEGEQACPPARRFLAASGAGREGECRWVGKQRVGRQVCLSARRLLVTEEQAAAARTPTKCRGWLCTLHCWQEEEWAFFGFISTEPWLQPALTPPA
jgi:hypothetical protein